MDSQFWGLVLVPGKKFSSESADPIRLTTACFGEKVVKGSRSCVILKTLEKEFVICVLSESKNESQSLDVLLPLEDGCSFYVTGPNEVYLTGQLMDLEASSEYEDEDSDDDERNTLNSLYENGSGIFEEGDSDDDEDYEVDSDEELEQANIEELGSDDDDDDDDEDEEEEEVEEVKPAASKKSAADNKKKPATPEPKKAEVAATEPEKPLSKSMKRKLAKQAKVELAKANGQQGEKRKADDEETPKSNNKKEKVDAKVNKKASEKPAAPKKEEPKITTLPNGLIIEDRVIGTGEVCKNGNKVSMRYIGRLPGRTKPFDKNDSGKPFSFKLGRGEVIRGWDLGVAGMKVGGERKLIIPAALGYGKQGALPDIPKNATLEFEVKLVEVKK